MAEQLQIPYAQAGKDVYAVIRNSAGQAARLDTHLFESYITADRGAYLLTLAEQGSASAYYAAPFPTWIAQGVYFVVFYVKKAGSRAENDTLAGTDTIDWTGADFAVQPTFPSNFAALGITGAGHISAIDSYTGDTPQTGDVFAHLPANFAALGVGSTGHILNVDTLTTYTGNTPQTGNVFGALPSNFSSLGITGIGHVATVDTVLVNADKVGYTLTQPFPTNFGVLLITPAGHVANVDTLTTYTGDTPQTGDVYAHLPPNFWQLGIASNGHILNVDTLTTYTGDTPQTGDVFGALPAHFADLGISVGGHISTVDTLGSGALGAVLLPALGGVPGPEPSLTDAVGWLYVLSRNLRVQTATVETVYADDGVTSVATSSKADTGTVFSRGKYT